MLTISIVGLTTQETLAVPLKPVLDQMGRRMVEGALGVDSDALATPPASQPSTNTQEATDSPPATPTYPPATYLPAYPAIPSNSVPVAPVYSPPAYPAIPPARSSPPVIINNF